MDDELDFVETHTHIDVQLFTKEYFKRWLNSVIRGMEDLSRMKKKYVEDDMIPDDEDFVFDSGLCAGIRYLRDKMEEL